MVYELQDAIRPAMMDDVNEYREQVVVVMVVVPCLHSCLACCSIRLHLLASFRSGLPILHQVTRGSLAKTGAVLLINAATTGPFGFPRTALLGLRTTPLSAAPRWLPPFKVSGQVELSCCL